MTEDAFKKSGLRNSFRYRLDNCVYKESEDESCKIDAVDLGIDKICCNIIVWDIYYWRKEDKLSIVPNSNITIDNKTYKHDFMDCVDGKYNSNGYYHINNLKVVSSLDIRIRNDMLYWFYPVHTDFSCKLNVSRIDHAPGSISIHSEIDDHTAQISNIDEWNDEELKDYLRRAKRTPDVISEKVLPIHQLFQDNVKSSVEKYMENMYGTNTEELDFGDELL